MAVVSRLFLSAARWSAVSGRVCAEAPYCSRTTSVSGSVVVAGIGEQPLAFGLARWAGPLDRFRVRTAGGLERLERERPCDIDLPSKELLLEIWQDVACPNPVEQ